jgi:NADPH:quinone reductase-like Zn-dependent oxidoreductase
MGKKMSATAQMSAAAPGKAITMKAIVYHRYGSPEVLQLESVAKPVPSDDQVLVRIHAASVNPYDWHFMRGLPYLVRVQAGLRKPKSDRLGVDEAGVVEAVGRNVTQFTPGDEVFGFRGGALAEYVCGKETSFAPKPAGLSFEQAAAIPCAGQTALQGLRDKGQLQPGQRVLINGASGGVGTFAVQIAKALGAHVTAVCSTRNVDLVRSLGADEVVDYTKDDFTRGGQRYDLMVDIVGNRSFFACRRVLTPTATFVTIGARNGRWLAPLIPLIRARLLRRFVSQKLVGFFAKNSKEDLLVLKDLIEAGKVTPVIDRSYPLRETPDAIRHLEAGHARGKIVVTI